MSMWFRAPEHLWRGGRGPGACPEGRAAAWRKQARLRGDGSGANAGPSFCCQPCPVRVGRARLQKSPNCPCGPAGQACYRPHFTDGQAEAERGYGLLSVTPWQVPELQTTKTLQPPNSSSPACGGGPGPVSACCVSVGSPGRWGASPHGGVCEDAEVQLAKRSRGPGSEATKVSDPHHYWQPVRVTLTDMTQSRIVVATAPTTPGMGRR